MRLVTVDGPAGSGKTTFAGRLATPLGDAAAVVHMDDVYAGWHDMEPSWHRLDEWVLTPLRAGRPARIRHYDWPADRFGDTWYDVPARAVLVVEGVGCGRRAAAPYTTLAVWVEAPREVRLRRGVERDGEAMRGEWLTWMAAEDEHFARERTRERADLVVLTGS